MADIDLTPMNEAAARALYAEETADSVIEHYPRPLGSEEKVQFRIAAREQAKALWDDGESVPGDVKFKYRDRALAVTLAAHKDVARQAWDQCAEHIRAHHNRGYLTAPSPDTLRAANPFEEGA